LGTWVRRISLTATLLLALTASAFAQDPSTNPVALPSGVTPANPNAKISEKQAREADDAYLEGAKHVEHGDLAAAERSFGRAAQLNPANRDYLLALADVREHRVTELVQAAAQARAAGQNDKANDLLAQAHILDPDNPVVTQHFGANLSPWETTADPLRFPAADIASTLAGPIELVPTPGLKDIHQRGGARDVVRAVYAAYGIDVVFDDSFNDSTVLRFDLDGVDFATATRILAKMTRFLAVAIQPQTALIAKNNQEQRDRLIPQIEETIYLPGVPQDEMSELANLARNIFDLKQVTASATAGDMIIRGDEPSLKLVNAEFAEILDGGSDVELDISLYELDRTHQVNIGAQLPSSASAFPLYTTATNLISANQTLINEAIQAGLLTLTGNPAIDLPKELALLISQNVSGSSAFANLLTVFGSFDGLPFAGVTVGGGSFNLLLNSSDVRMLDAVTLRGTSGQDLNFRSGTRYPVITSTYSSGISGGLASQLSGININGTSAASLLQQFLGSTSNVSIPTFQFEDLGITLKTKPQVLHTGGVSLTLDMKIEALAGGALNSIPILNSRTLTSTINVPAGQSALLASNLSTTEMRALLGLPGLSELPGFQGTDQNTEKDRGELLITITPHVIRSGAMRIASRPILTPHIGPTAQ
jgi:tetratricopeptide (TPR) repeat protein